MRKMPKLCYIYGLKDPRDGQIYYVGKSNDPKQRKRAHLKNRESNAARIAWLDSLAQCGLESELVILEKVLPEEWRETERYWIARGVEENWPLVNIADGGPNSAVPPSYDFMRSYVRPDLWAVFDGLSIRDKDTICLLAASAMADEQAPVLEHKLSLHKYGTNQYAMWNLLDEAGVWAAAQAAMEAVEQKVQI